MNVLNCKKENIGFKMYIHVQQVKIGCQVWSDQYKHDGGVFSVLSSFLSGTTYYLVQNVDSAVQLRNTCKYQLR